MTQQSKQGQLPAANPLASLLVIIVGALTIAVSVVVGFFAFVALAGFILIMAMVVAIRTWLMQKRVLARATKPTAEEPSAPTDNAVIEGEFKVVGKDEPPRHDR